MRAILSIDVDVLSAVRERARREGRSAGAVLSDLARHALANEHTSPASPAEAFFGFEPLPHRGEAVSNALIGRLRDQGTV